MRKQMKGGNGGGLLSLATTASSFFELLNPFAWFGATTSEPTTADPKPSDRQASFRKAPRPTKGLDMASLRSGSPRSAQPQYYTVNQSLSMRRHQSGESTVHSTSSSIASSRSPLPVRFLMSEAEIKIAQQEGAFNAAREPVMGTKPTFPSYLTTAYSELECSDGKFLRNPLLESHTEGRDVMTPSATARSVASVTSSRASRTSRSPLPSRFLMSESAIKYAMQEGTFNELREPVAGTKPSFPTYLTTAYTELDCSDAELQTLSA